MALKDWLWVAVLGIAWGAAFYFNEILLTGLGPLSVSAARVGLGALGCWAWVLITRRRLAYPMKRMVEMAVLGTFMFALPFAIYPIGQQYVGASAAGIVNALTPIMTVIVSHLWPGGEKASLRKSVGVGCGFAGIVVLLLPELGQNSPRFGAMLVMMLAPVCYAVALNWVRRLADIHYAAMLTWTLTFGAVIIGTVALLVEGVPARPTPEIVGAALAAGVGLVSVAFLIFYWLYPRVGATNLSTVTFIAPASAVLLGVLLLGERLGANEVLGMAAIFVGLMVIDGRVLRLFRKAQLSG